MASYLCSYILFAVGMLTYLMNAYGKRQGLILDNGDIATPIVYLLASGVFKYITS